MYVCRPCLSVADVGQLHCFQLQLGPNLQLHLMLPNYSYGTVTTYYTMVLNLITKRFFRSLSNAIDNELRVADASAHRVIFGYCKTRVPYGY